VRNIVKRTLPLVLFGAEGYAACSTRIAVCAAPLRRADRGPLIPRRVKPPNGGRSLTRDPDGSDIRVAEA
jgi:hypothetical protein